VVHGLANIIVYIDDLIVHSASHDDHLRQLDALFSCLAVHNLKVKLQKCVFGSRKVQYLGFLLSEDGIRPGTDKLKAVSHAQPPTTVKEVRQFLGLCNFFCTHVRNFAQILAPLTALTRKDATWINNVLPGPAMAAFRELQSILCSEPVIKLNFLLSKQLPFEPALRNLIFQLSLQSFIEDGVLWTRLKNTPEKRVVIMAPADIIPDILRDAHGHILAGHDGVLKTKERILQSYYWPGMDQDIQLHIQKCHQCQLRKPS
jgi:hypothetical protein